MTMQNLFRGQRRFITVLAIEADGAASSDGAFPQAITDICMAHGGTPNPVSANTLLCDFGTGEPTEDHAFVAYTAAQKIIADTQRNKGPSVRIALCSGDAVIKRAAINGAGGDIVTGEILATALRILKTVAANRMLVDERAASQLGKYFTFAKVFALAQDGHAPIGVYKKTANIPAVAGTTVPGVRTVLQHEIRAVLLRDVAPPVWLQGDAGIGKSFLAEQAIRDLQDEGIEKIVRISFYPQPVANPASIERRIFSALFPSGFDAMAAARAPALNQVVNGAMINDCMRDIMGLAVPAASAYAYLDAASKVNMRRSIAANAISHVQKSSKAVFIFEDMHWAGEDDVQTIDAILSRLEGRPPALIFTSRKAPQLDAAVSRRLRVFDIPTLSYSQTERLLASLSRQARLPKDAIDRLHGLSAGNPYFLKEYFGWIKGTMRHGGTMEDALYLIDSEMPGEIANIVQTRLARLGPRALTVAKTASVQGLRVDAAILAAMSGLPATELEDVLHDMQECGILRRDESSESWEFAHEIMQRAIYASIPASQRSSLHGGAMRHLRALRGHDIHASLAYHARHAQLAHCDYIYSKWAARKAKSQSQHESALHHLTLARKALRRMRGKFNRARHEAVIKFEEIGSLFITSRYAAVKARIKSVLDAKGALLGTHILKETLSFQGLMYWINGEIPKAAQTYNALLKNSSPIQDPELFIRESTRLAHICIDLGHYQQAIDHAEEALRLLEGRDLYAKYGLLSQVGPSLYSSLAMAHAKRGNHKEAKRFHEQALLLLRENQDYFTHVYVSTMLAHGLIVQNRPGEAVDLLRSALYYSTVVQSALLKPYILSGLGLALAQLGRAAEGLSYGAAAIDIAKKSHLQSRRALFHIWYAETLMIDQQYEAALPLLKKGIKGAMASGEEGRLAQAYYLMAECHQRLGIEKPEEWMRLYKKARLFAKGENVVPLQRKIDAAEAASAQGAAAESPASATRHG